MARNWMSLVLAALVTVALPAAGAEPAQPTPEQLDAARALAEAGFQLYEQGDYATALDRFTEAEEIYHAPPHVLFIGRTNAQLDRLLEARRAYERLATEELGDDAPEQFRTAQQEAQAELEQLRERIPTLAISIRGTAAGPVTVRIDGQPVAPEALGEPVELNPGEHLVELAADGHETTSQRITVEEASATPLELTLGPTKEAGTGDAVGPGSSASEDGDDGPSLVPPIIVGSVGIALVGVGAVTGALTLDRAGELKDRCPQNPCPPDNESLGDEVETLGTVSTVTFIAGGAAVAAGVLWLVLQGGGAPGEGDETAAGPTLRVVVGGPYAGLEGTF